MIDGLNRLRHHAVIGGDHQHDNVRDFRPARPHRRKGLMARRIQERDQLASRRHDIGADVLGDPARFSFRDLRLANGVQQGRLPVIDMPHDGHHGGSGDRRRLDLRSFLYQKFLGRPFRRHLNPHAERFRQQTSGLGGDGLIEGHEHVHLHELLDHVGRLLSHRLGEILYRQAFRQLHGLQPGFGDFCRSTRRRMPGFFFAPMHRHRAQIAPAGGVVPERQRFVFAVPHRSARFFALVFQALIRKGLDRFGPSLLRPRRAFRWVNRGKLAWG